MLALDQNASFNVIQRTPPIGFFLNLLFTLYNYYGVFKLLKVSLDIIIEGWNEK